MRICVLTRPYREEDIRANLDKEGHISGNVPVSLADVISRDLEGFIDLVSEKLVGSDLLMDVSYEVVGVNQESGIVIKVSGDPSAHLRGFLL